MKKIVTVKFNGSTLIEVIVAMVIILTCLTAGMTIISNNRKSLNDPLRIQAELNISAIVSECKQSVKFFDGTYDFDNMNIEMEIKPYPECGNIRVLYLAAYTLQHKFICDYRELVPVNLIEHETLSEP